MKLTNMKRPAKKASKLTAEKPYAEKERYPYGLQITFEKEEIKKLGIALNDFDVNDVIGIIAKAKITSISSRDDVDYQDQSIRAQITDLAIKEKENIKSIVNKRIKG